MKLNRLCTLFTALLLSTQSQAITGIIGTGTNSSAYMSPFLASGGTDPSIRAMSYSAVSLSGIGLMPGMTVNEIKWYKTTNDIFINGTTATAILYMRYDTITYNSGYGTGPYNVIGHISSGFMPVDTVYYDDGVNNIDSGWIGFTNLNFLYTGEDIELYVDYLTTTNNSGPNTTGPIQFTYSAGNGRFMYLDDPVTSSSIFTHGSRPNTMFVFSAQACNGTPDAGDAVTDAPGAICEGVSFGLDLVDYTSVQNQTTFTWEIAPGQNGPWSTYSAPLSQPLIGMTAPGNTTWYRALVECGSNSAYSTPVELVVSPGLQPGTYTIDNGQPTAGTNFNSFNDAVLALECGIDGPIVIDVAANSGPYNEQVMLHPVPGADATNTVTFNGNGTTLSHTANNATQRATLKLDGADHIRINDLKVVVSGDTGFEHGHAIHLVNDADDNIIHNCEVTVNTTTSSDGDNTYVGILINGYNEAPLGGGYGDCDRNEVSGNAVTGGYYGIAFMGDDQNNPNEATKVMNNIVRDFYSYGIYSAHNDGAVIEGNDISRPTRSNIGNFYGIHLNPYHTNTKVNANRIYAPAAANMTTSSFAAGISVWDLGTTNQNSPNTISNNLVYDFKSEGSHFGLMLNGVENLKVYHNTFSLEYENTSCDGCGAFGVYQHTAAATSLDFKNNLISINGTGTGHKRAMQFANNTDGEFDHNNYYFDSSIAANAQVGEIAGNLYNSLSDWQIVMQDEQNTITEKPQYANPSGGDFTPMNADMDNKGTFVGVQYDITGAQRNANTPDIGAYEINPVTNSVKGVAKGAAIDIYPNPVKDVLNIVSAEKVNAVLTGIDGRVVMEQQNAKKLNMSALAEGVYILKLTNAEGELLKAEKVVKQ